ncbi:hypothetical protein EJ05DRAFT_488788 [Pseudovirgaria hyperparasitica]|uniref:Uncharacterized protein n=1 Tax=Pseudovirgaria hyperparasitica TaxID=470096 RepID=A0A6A6VX75_9PEZI|nr:uncharacterized protein EJ05DRAFT_488788 [Pseudovirgaria hyperparasitica]KAF2755268.1 hypothetical protein EJ05DRAFT_488788 [Pseudovirgaria hyperparasitica]
MSSPYANRSTGSSDGSTPLTVLGDGQHTSGQSNAAASGLPVSVPFTLSLNEIGRSGQFQLVVNVNAENATDRPTGQTHQSRELQAIPSLGPHALPLHQGNKSSPTLSLSRDAQGWVDLSSIPSAFVQNAAPEWDWLPSGSGTLPHQAPTRRNDLKARIKRSGRGIIVRLRKGSTAGPSEGDDVKDIHLIEHQPEATPTGYELETPDVPVELDSTPIIPEIGSSGPNLGAHVRQLAPHQYSAVGPFSVSNQTESWPARSPPPVELPGRLARNSISVGTEGFSDAETLIHGAGPIGDLWDETDTQSSTVPCSIVTEFSTTTTRRNSLSSILSTPVGGLQLSEVAWPESAPVDNQDGRRESSWEDLREIQADETAIKTTERKKSHRSRIIRPSRSTVRARFVVPESHNVPSRLMDWPPKHGDDEVLGGYSKLAPPLGELKRRWFRSEDADNANVLQRRSKSFNALKPPHSQARKVIGRSQSASIPVPVLRAKPGKLKLRTKCSQRNSDDVVSTGSPPTTVKTEEQQQSPTQRSTQSESPVVSFPIQQPQPYIKQPDTQTQDSSTTSGPLPLPQNYETRLVDMRSRSKSFVSLAAFGLLSLARNAIDWLGGQCGPEHSVKEGFVRVRWTCHCGEVRYDDFIERRVGAARELEAYLNRPQSHTPRMHTNGSSTSSTPSISSAVSSIFSNPALSPSSTFGTQSSLSSNLTSSSPKMHSRQNPFSVVISPPPTPSWLLTCVNEGRATPKVVHLDMTSPRIKSDKDLALTLRSHYASIKHPLLHILRVRGLTTIHFVQFEVHRNRFADIRKSPDMPSGALAKTWYDFEPHDLVPPVGEKYLLHLFKHPQDYDGELITYLRSPKRKKRLDVGVGWGIHLVEGFLPARVWTLMLGMFGLGSLVFAVVWVCVRRDDMQGAFGVAAWMTTLAGLSVAWAQASLE